MSNTKVTDKGKADSVLSLSSKFNVGRQIVKTENYFACANVIHLSRNCIFFIRVFSRFFINSFMYIA